MSIPSRILYVEDDPDIQAIATVSLESVGGFHVIACDGGPPALAVAKEAMPDLVILDVMMPDMDGPTVLKALRALPGGDLIPAIFMTAKVQPAEVATLQQPGVIGVISKPFDPMTLSQTVQALWDKHTEKKI